MLLLPLAALFAGKYGPRKMLHVVESRDECIVCAYVSHSFGDPAVDQHDHEVCF